MSVFFSQCTYKFTKTTHTYFKDTDTMKISGWEKKIWGILPTLWYTLNPYHTVSYRYKIFSNRENNLLGPRDPCRKCSQPQDVIYFLKAKINTSLTHFQDGVMLHKIFLLSKGKTPFIHREMSSDIFSRGPKNQLEGRGQENKLPKNHPIFVLPRMFQFTEKTVWI